MKSQEGKLPLGFALPKACGAPEGREVYGQFVWDEIIGYGFLLGPLV